MNPTPSPAPKKKRRSKARPKSEHKIPERKRKEIVYELSPQDRLCFSCPLPDCVGESSVRCPIWQEKHMLRMLRRRNLVQLAKQNRSEIDNTPAPMRSAAWND